MAYSEEIVNQVRDANDIVSVVGQYVKLTKKGANYFGLCPFHGEKTASFSVSPRKQIFYCFGCQKGGDVFHFIREYEQVSYPEAIRILADRAHITLPEEHVSYEDRKKKELRERLLEINKEAAYYYHDRLMLPEGQSGLSYLRDKRRLSKGTITHFGLGYSGKSNGDLYRLLKNKGYTDQELRDCGLFTISERGTTEKFWNRVMFPIMDINNRVIAFGGRVMGDGEPKYLNSPETPIFNKSSVLYGLNFARKSREKFMLLCEGYMDVISLHQAGFTNAVASLGTAFTDLHAKLLRRYTDTVILTQDSDAAGINAKIKAFPVLHDAGLKVKILDMGAYKDPDEFIKANGPDAYRELIGKAQNAFLYIINVIRKNYDMSDPAAVTEYYNDVAKRLAFFTDPVERESYLTAACREQMIDYELLKTQTEKYTGAFVRSLDYSPAPKTYVRREAPSTDRKIQSSCDILLYYMISDEKIRGTVFSFLSPGEFPEEESRFLAERLSGENGTVDAISLLKETEGNEELYRRLNAILIGKGIPGSQEEETGYTEETEKLLTDALRNLKSHAITTACADASLDMKKYQELIREKSRIREIEVHLTHD